MNSVGYRGSTSWRGVSTRKKSLDWRPRLSHGRGYSGHIGSPGRRGLFALAGPFPSRRVWHRGGRLQASTAIGRGRDRAPRPVLRRGRAGSFPVAVDVQELRGTVRLAVAKGHPLLLVARASKRAGAAATRERSASHRCRRDRRSERRGTALGLPQNEARAVLESLRCAASHPQIGLLVPSDVFGGRRGHVRALDKLRWLEARRRTQWRYTHCCLEQLVSLAGSCSADRCFRAFVPVDEPEREQRAHDNHHVHVYRHVYRKSHPLSGIAREHTAAIEIKPRERIEAKFRDG